MKLKIIVPALLILVTSVFAKASCINSYQSAIDEMKFASAKGMGKSVALAIATFIFPPSGIAKFGVYSIRGKLSYDGTRRLISVTDLKDVKDLIEQSAVGQGEMFEFAFKVVKEEIPQAKRHEVAQKIYQDNINGLYCADNNLSVMSEVLISLGVSEKFARKKADARNNMAEFHPLTGH